MLTLETVVLLLQMLMVLFDILVSHRRMSKWHEKQIQSHLLDQQAIYTAKLELQQRIDSNAQASSSRSEPHSSISDRPHVQSTERAWPEHGNMSVSQQLACF